MVVPWGLDLGTGVLMVHELLLGLAERESSIAGSGVSGPQEHLSLYFLSLFLGHTHGIWSSWASDQTHATAVTRATALDP